MARDWRKTVLTDEGEKTFTIVDPELERELEAFRISIDELSLTVKERDEQLRLLEEAKKTLHETIEHVHEKYALEEHKHMKTYEALQLVIKEKLSLENKIREAATGMVKINETLDTNRRLKQTVSEQLVELSKYRLLETPARQKGYDKAFIRKLRKLLDES